MDWIVSILLIGGAFFFLIGTIGVLRFPDFYARLHAAGKCDTLAAILTLSGIALYNLNDFSFANILVSGKVLAIIVFVFIASPTATHAITKAAILVGVKPWEKKKEVRT
jgi:multicomponent Na+:H+ antiporter subunit G